LGGVFLGNLAVVGGFRRPFYSRVTLELTYTDPLGRYLDLTGQRDAEGNLLTSNPETGGRYHSAWLSMMYPRLFIARQLLREDGVIFVSIDDHEVHNLRMVMNEIFGEENFVATIIWQKIFAPKNTARHFSEDHDYILVYAHNAEIWRPNLLPRNEDTDARYQNLDNDPRGLWSSGDLTARNYYSEGQYEVTSPSGTKFLSPRGRYWVVNEERFLELDRDNRVWWGESGGNMPRRKRFLSEVQQGIVPQTLWKYEDVGHTQEAKKELLAYVAFGETENVLNTVKPPRLLQRMLQIGTNASDSDIVLDFFSGSASTAHAVLAQNHEDNGNRRFIMVQFPEPLPKPEANLKTIADIGTERIRHFIRQAQGDRNGQMTMDLRPDEDLGFRVFKLAPSHIRPWRGVEDATPEAYAGQMALFDDPLVAGWTVDGLAYEIALKEGYGLNSIINPHPAPEIPAIPPPLAGEGKRVGVFRITDPDKAQSLTLCLADAVPPDIIAALGLAQDDLFICRDAALTDDLAANLALQCRIKTI
ncbi:MAG: site-specific DNA-methyltransferase, partial [Anaerolineae bacterium]|nr:site-specific DNA-methyltransferase [Anaerolineae bacterium]